MVVMVVEVVVVVCGGGWRCVEVVVRVVVV